METQLRARALRLLARREHSREELRRKLAAHGGEGIDLDALLDDFTRRGWLSEERFVEQAVRAKASKFGLLRIAHHLRQRGIDEAGIAQAVSQAASAEEETLAAVWRSRFGTPADDAAGMARQVRFLQGRGFALDAILRMLRNVQAER
jgi:regulatory protein